LTPKLEGLEAIWPKESVENGTYHLDIEPGKDHIIILRRIKGQASYGL
jgi:hypothetical protein